MVFTEKKLRQLISETVETEFRSWRDNPLFTIGKYKGQEKLKIITDNPEYCLWLHNNSLEKISNTPFSLNELARLDISYYRKHRIFPIKSPDTPKHAKISGKLVCDMSAEELQDIFNRGDGEIKWLVRQEHKNRGWKRNPQRGLNGAPAFQSDDVGDSAWQNN